MILFRTGLRAIFVFGFAKSDQANLSAAEIRTFKRAAKVALGLSSAAIDAEAEAGRLIEVSYDKDL